MRKWRWITLPKFFLLLAMVKAVRMSLECWPQRSTHVTFLLKQTKPTRDCMTIRGSCHSMPSIHIVLRCHHKVTRCCTKWEGGPLKSEDQIDLCPTPASVGALLLTWCLCGTAEMECWNGASLMLHNLLGLSLGVFSELRLDEYSKLSRKLVVKSQDLVEKQG